MNHGSRQAATLQNSLHSKLNNYALVATAAGVGALGLAQPAEARIVYTKTHHVINENTVDYLLDLTNKQHPEFVFVNYGMCSSQGGCRDTLGLAIMSGGDFFEEKSNLVTALRKGAVIGPRAFSSKVHLGGLMAEASWTTGGKVKHSGGPWLNVRDRYVGLKFSIHGKPHFGWARLSVSFDTTHAIQATLTGYAYETVSNRPIKAGQTLGSDAALAESASLGRLAAGKAVIPSQPTESDNH